MADTIRIAADGIAAEISPLGAELQRLQDEEGRDLLWDGDPAFWTGRAPILFPIVGRVAEDRIMVDGRAYPLPKHGFARKRMFAVVAREADKATFRLEADDETRAAYPFGFRLDLTFVVAGRALTCTATLANPGDAPLPASFGFHPAFRWPLPWGGARADHAIRFAAGEPAPIRRIDAAGLLRPEPEPTPVEGDTLRLRDALFEDDALIFDRLVSRSLAYGVPGGRTMRIDFPDLPLLGIWMKPGADYVCIEPWQGVADPSGHDGEFAAKPGVVMVDPGATRRWTMRVAI